LPSPKRPVGGSSPSCPASSAVISKKRSKEMKKRKGIGR
jgi:hypothetical protein